MATTGAKSTKDDKFPEGDAATLNADIQQLREDIALLKEHLMETGNRSVFRARKAAKDSAEQLRGSADEFQEDIAERVREKPLTAVALAAGIGYLFAMITRR